MAYSARNRTLTAIVVIAIASDGCAQKRTSFSQGNKMVVREGSASAPDLAMLPPDSGMPEFVSFEEVTEKVWEVDREPRAMVPTLDKERIHRVLRRSSRSCLCPTLPGIVDQLPPDFYLSLSIDIDAKGTFTTKLGGFLDHSQDPKSKIVRALSKMEECIEDSLRTAGFDRKYFQGKPFRIRYPFNLGSRCSDVEE